MAVSKLLILRSRVDRFRLDNAGISLNLTIPAEAYTIWLAGGGVRGGLAYGETDEYDYEAVSDRVHLHDLHATMLFSLGLDHQKLTYRYAGRDFRLTDVYGRVVNEIMA